MTNLAHKIALVSGGLRGIGLAAVQRFLRDGAIVYVADLDTPDSAQAEMKKLGANAHYLQLNVTQEDEWKVAAKIIGDAHGRLDILVNNAGVDCVGPVESIEYSAWKRIMAVNVDGPFLGLKTFVPLLISKDRDVKDFASVINISSIMGKVGYVDTSPYNASKGAITLFTKATAIEFAQKRMPIRVNSVHPGFVTTPLLHKGMAGFAQSMQGVTADDLIAQLAASTPNGRVADPEEIAAAIAFLASGDSSYMTGAELVVDGGWTAQ